MKKRILILHGPNLNLLGVREKTIYGAESLESINAELLSYANSRGLSADVFQTNHEGELVDKIHLAREEYDGIVLNAGAYTHYSVAIRDAIAAVCKPCVEVHLTNVFAREEFRHHSVLSPVCLGVICGFGRQSYLLAIDALRAAFEAKL